MKPFRHIGELKDYYHCEDVDPLLAQKDAEIIKLGQALAQLNSAPVEEIKRIEELEAENARLNELLRLEFRPE